jgi:hypothetical protein
MNKFRTITVPYSQDSVTFSVTVARANGLIGRDHAEMLSALLDGVEAGEVKPSLESLAYMQAACVPAAVEWSGFDSWPPTLDEFADLPEVFLNSWYGAVRELNPHWWAVAESEEASVKKVIASTQS